MSFSDLTTDEGYIDSSNSTTTPLAADATYTGGWVDVSGYNAITTYIYSDQDSASLGGILQFSTNASDVDLEIKGTYTGGVGHPVTVQPHASYFRFKYTNGSTLQTTFKVQTVLRRAALTDPHLRVDDHIPTDITLPIQRNVITGQKPNNDYVNFQATAAGNFKVSVEEVDSSFAMPCVFPDGPTIDHFYRLRVSDPFDLWQSKQIHGADERFHNHLSGSATATYDGDESLVRLTVGSATGHAVRRTERHIQYAPGKSQYVMITGGFDVGVANVVQKMGYYDDRDGAYYYIDGTTAGIGIRSSVTGTVVNTTITQANFNVDPLDGTGPSGLNINLATLGKAVWYAMDIGWLGVSGVRFYAMLNGRNVVHLHTYEVSGLNTAPFWKKASLPLTYEIEAEATITGTKSLTCICSSVTSEGGEGLTPFEFSMSSGWSLTTVNSTGVYLGIGRCKETLNSIINRRVARFISSNFYSADRDVYIEMRHFHSPTVTGGSWVSAGDDSGVEYNTTMSSVTGTYHRIDGFWVPTGTGLSKSGISIEQGIGADEHSYFYNGDDYTTDKTMIAIWAQTQTLTSDVGFAASWREYD